MLNTKTLLIPTALTAMTLALTACMKPSAQSKTVIGTINGFSSVIVNGTRFNTTQARVTVDGVTAMGNHSALAPGMKVTVKGTQNGQARMAESIDYDHEIEGVVISNSIPAGASEGTMDVMGQTVKVTLDTVLEVEVPGVASVDVITPGMIVEISGYSDGNGNVTATYISVEAADQAMHEKDHPEGMDVEGLITNLDKTNMTFDLGTVTVDYANATLSGFPAGIENDFYVEVSTVDPVNNGTIIAKEVAMEDDGDMDYDGEEGEEVEIEGMITAVPVGTVMEVSGQEVRLDTALTVLQGIQNNSLVIGGTVRVEGVFDAAGAVIAKAIAAVQGAGSKIGGQIATVDITGPGEGTITIGDKTIIINSETTMDDDRDLAGMGGNLMLSLAGLISGDLVDIDYYMDPDTGEYYATNLERM